MRGRPGRSRLYGMKPMPFCRVGLLGVLPIIAACLAGCAADKPSDDELVKANLIQIAKAYLMVLSYNRKGLRDMDELRSAVNDLHRLQMGAPPEEALVSPRDKQPLVIILGADSSDRGDAILAYEQQGLDGNRWIVTMGADLKQLRDEEFAKAPFAKNHKPKGT